MVALVVILTILIFLTIDLFVQQARCRPALVAALPLQEGSIGTPAPGRTSFAATPPEGSWLDPSHVWIREEAVGCVRVGVDEFPVGLLGNPESIDFLPGGTDVHRGDPLVTLRKGSRSLTLPAPFDGSVLAFNTEAKWAPDLLGRDAFGGGWLYLIWPHSDCKPQGLREGTAAAGWIREELSRLREQVAGLVHPGDLVGATMPDGGPPLEGIAGHLEPDQWEQLSTAFFSNGTNGEPPASRGRADPDPGAAHRSAS